MARNRWKTFRRQQDSNPGPLGHQAQKNKNGKKSINIGHFYTISVIKTHNNGKKSLDLGYFSLFQYKKLTKMAKNVVKKHGD